MIDFDDFAAANQGGLRPARRPGDAVLRARARTHDTEEDWTRGAGLAPPPQTAPKRQGGLVDGIAAYKQMAGRTGLAETKPVAAPIGATRTPSVRDGTKPPAAPAKRAPTGPRPNAKWGDSARASGAGSVGDLGGATSRALTKPRPAAAGLVGSPDPTPRPQRSEMISTNVPDSRSPGAVDGLITQIMRFAETLPGVDPQQKHDRVAEIWSWPYRGTYQPGTWGKTSVPAVGTHAILDGVASRWPDMVPPHLLDDTDLILDDKGNGVGRRDIAWYDPFAARPDPRDALERRTVAATHHGTRHRAHMDVEDPLDQTGEGGPDIDPDALLKVAPPADPRDGDREGRAEEVQVAGRTAMETISRYLLGLPGGTASDEEPTEDEGPSRGRWPSTVDEFLDMEFTPSPIFGPPIRLRDILEAPLPSLPGYEGEAPDIEDREEFPIDPDGGRSVTVTTPDGAEIDIDGSPPPSENQSNNLPQGTILNIEPDDRGGHIVHGGPTPKSPGYPAGGAEPGVSDPMIPLGPDDRRDYEEWMVETGQALLDRARNNPGQTVAPAESYIWGEMRPHRGTVRSNGQGGRRRRYYEWDHTHGEIEVYDSRGDHVGAIDSVTGEWVKPPRKGRDIREKLTELERDGQTTTRSA